MKHRSLFVSLGATPVILAAVSALILLLAPSVRGADNASWQPAAHDWSLRSNNDSKDSQVYTEQQYRLYNETLGQTLRCGERKYGINLVWTNIHSDSEFSFHLKSKAREPLQSGQTVAIRVRNYKGEGGYLRFKRREYGINLVWSNEPVYEWEVRGDDTRQPIRLSEKIGLFNRNVEFVDYMVYYPREYGVNLKWWHDVPERERDKRIKALGKD